MMEEKQKLTLDRLARYQIIVPGHLDESWLDGDGKITITIASDSDGLPLTILTGSFDQAALVGLLRRIYSMGLPLISVNCVED
jgi:hypothetical protein